MLSRFKNARGTRGRGVEGVGVSPVPWAVAVLSAGLRLVAEAGLEPATSGE